MNTGMTVSGLAAAIMLLGGCSGAGHYYVKKAEFPAGISPQQKIDMAARVVPTESQLAWQELEQTAFLHFGMNTFTNREWGYGNENPALFNPAGLDAEQWVRALQAGGFRMVILTAKHHDGFCLWPTKTTAHSVVSSPWKDGKGDVVRELKAACDKYGMKFGLYLSPWDRNAACYGDSPVYNRMFMDQLRELLGNYGRVDEVWFDGANAEGPNGRKQVYDWKAFYRVIDSLQPQAVKAIMGDDVRWVGNERGYGRETEWSVTPLTPDIYDYAVAENGRLGLAHKGADLGSREKVEAADRLFWYPSEVDVSIRPGWFWHPEEDGRVKTLAKLVDIYFRSVGYNSVLLLNVPPDSRGLIHENDAERLREFGDYLSKTFSDNRLTDGEREVMLQPGQSVEYRVRPDAEINTFMVREDIRRGQRVEEFLVEVAEGGQWREVARGTTIGYKRLLRFPSCRPDKVRLTMVNSRAEVYVAGAGAFLAENLQDRTEKFHSSDLPSAGWQVKADSETNGMEARLAFDGNPGTCWKSESSAGNHWLEADLGALHTLSGFTYTPVAGNDKAGTVFLYCFSVSTDGQNWTPCEHSGEFSNIMHNPEPQTVRFAKPCPARYIRFESLSEIGGQPFVTVAELGILTQ